MSGCRSRPSLQVRRLRQVWRRCSGVKLHGGWRRLRWGVPAHCQHSGGVAERSPSCQGCGLDQNGPGCFGFPLYQFLSNLCERCSCPLHGAGAVSYGCSGRRVKHTQASRRGLQKSVRQLYSSCVGWKPHSCNSIGNINDFKSGRTVGGEVFKFQFHSLVQHKGPHHVKSFLSVKLKCTTV